MTGSLGVFVEDDSGGRRLVAHIPAGETVGEMSLITGDPHSAQIVALRDTELLRVSADAFDALIARHPRVMLNLMRVLVRRLQETTQRPVDRARPKSFAVIPLQDGLGRRTHRPAHRRRAGRDGLQGRGARFRFGRQIRRMVQHLRSRA